MHKLARADWWFWVLPLAVTWSGCDDDGGPTTPRQEIRGSGNVTVVSRQVGDFSGVSMETLGAVTITQADTTSLRIEAEDNLIPLILSEIRDGTLHLWNAGDVQLVPTQPIEIVITAPAIVGMVLSGNGSIDAPNLTASQLSAVMSGLGDIDLTGLDAGNLSLVLSGSGQVNVTGEVQSQEIVVSGLGDYNGGTLVSTTASVVISGSGIVTLRVSDALNVVISGIGDVFYFGDPIVESTVTGTGNVERLGAAVRTDAAKGAEAAR